MKLHPLLSILTLLPLAAHAQSTAHPGNTQKAVTLKPVQVQAKSEPDADHADLGSYGKASLSNTPATIVVIDREQLDAHNVRTLRDLARLDADAGDSYAPVGYYQNISLRGYALDFATGYRINNLIVTGEQRMPLENKQQVQILSGLAGIQAGVMQPGGVVNYVDKRSADVTTITMGTDQHGSRYTALDAGRWLTPTFGLRANLAWEDIHSFVEHADGRRNFYSLAADWLPSESDRIEFDADYQASAQRSVSGYKLLGGTQIPPHADPTRMLGYQPWAQPVSIHTFNGDLRWTHDFNPDWQWHTAASHSRSVIDDNVAFAWGCWYLPVCSSGAAPGDYFAPDGGYDIYDYRSPGDTRVSDQLRSGLDGAFDTGSIHHQISFGLSLFHRSIHRPRNVYDYVGSANINDPEPPVFAPSPNQPGAEVRRFDSWQRSLWLLDRLHFGERWQLVAGTRFVRLHGRDWDDDQAHTLERDTRLSRSLPQLAVLWKPLTGLTTYASWSEGLSLGQEAPDWTSNSGAILPPRLSRQIEAGIKYRWNTALDLQASVYRIHQPWQFAQPDGSSSGYTFIQRGEEVHTGLSLTAKARLGTYVSTHASVGWIHARATDTGTPAFEGHQLVNVPALRSNLGFDFRIPGLQGLVLRAGWRHAAANPATPDGHVQVKAHDVFDAGLRYRLHGPRLIWTWRLSVDNLFDTFYWSDTGATGGDAYLFPGNPRMARLTLNLAFPE